MENSKIRFLLADVPGTAPQTFAERMGGEMNSSGISAINIMKEHSSALDRKDLNIKGEISFSPARKRRREKNNESLKLSKSERGER
jgi:hypothetical protein